MVAAQAEGWEWTIWRERKMRTRGTQLVIWKINGEP